MIYNIFQNIIGLSNSLRARLSPSVNSFFLKNKCVKVGKGFWVIGKVSIIGSGKIAIGDNFCMTSGDHVNPISANLQASIFTDSPNAQIQIGDNVGMSSPRMWIHDSLTIGNNVKIGGGVLLIDTDCHPIDYCDRRISNKGTFSSPIVIEDDVWIGAQSIVLKGVTIGARSIIGAGSVVTNNIPADCIAGGNPCKIIRKIKTER